MARVERVSSHRPVALEGWQLAETPAGAAADPAQLEALAPTWIAATVPGTAAGALRAAGAWDFERPRNFDAVDWWYRASFTGDGGAATVLRLDGLATVADVWLNGTHVLASDNMFVAHELDVRALVGERNQLVLRFRALEPLLAARRPRPRWRTRLVTQQQLRWHRTTLVGRIPAWMPPVTAVGPWRPITVEERAGLAVRRADVRARLDGEDGVVEAALRVDALGAARPREATLWVGETRTPLACRAEVDVFVVEGAARLPAVQRWWPHTHGAQPLYTARVVVQLDDGSEVELDCGRLGFRSVTVDTEGDGFAVRVNGVPVFCRGACWTPLDVVTLATDEADARAALQAARDAGMNMLRVGGTMVYEADAFYRLCDELGILVWQEFMFANLDYPATDAVFLDGARREAEQTLDRLQLHPSVALFCGNSEVEQQAAMLGLPRELWTNALFSQLLPELVRAHRPDAPYVPSSPSGGALPFEVGSGVAHYFGVGAYLRPLEDARRSGVRFTSECLAFSNVPEPRTVEMVMGAGESPVHHPRWKRRVPRDAGAGWDFEDVRDHYLRLLFGPSMDPVALRYADMERYLAFGRVVTGEVMASVFAEWRRARSSCRGGLIWFYRDLWPGAGWGVLDAVGRPKAAYYYLKRVLQPIALLVADEGLSGLRLHALNESAAPVDAELRLTLYRHGHVQVATGAQSLTLPPRGEVEVQANALFEAFLDTTYAYRFGPPGHDLAVATLHARDGGTRLGEAFHFPLGLPSAQAAEVGLEATATPSADGSYALRVHTRSFAQSVAIEADGFWPDDNYFHLAPGATRTIALRPTGGGPLKGVVQPLNAHAAAKIVVAPHG